MESSFYTLQEFMSYTKGAAYIIVGIMILCILGFWLYLTGRDDDKLIR